MRRYHTDTIIPTHDNRWRATDEGLQNAKTGVLNLANFVKADHYPNGFIPGGLPVDAADMNDLKPFQDIAGAVLRIIPTAQVIQDGETVLAVPVQLTGAIYPQLIPGGLATPIANADTTGWTLVEPAPAVVLGTATATTPDGGAA